MSLAYILLVHVFVIWWHLRAGIPSFPTEGYSLKWFRAIPGTKVRQRVYLQFASRRGRDLDALAIGVPPRLACAGVCRA